MTNERIEIHDPFSGQNGISNSTTLTKKSDSSSENTEDMVEFRILMAYATRRRPKETPESEQETPSTPNGNNVERTVSSESKTITEKKKKKFWKRMSKAFTCVKPKTTDELPVGNGEDENGEDENNAHEGVFRCGGEENEDHLEDVAAQLAKLSDEIPFAPPELETDCPDDDVEKVIGLILRDAGDRLYESELKGTNFTSLLGNYGFFEKVITTLLTRMGLNSDPETLGPKVSTKTQMAVTCEATHRLSVLDTMPKRRLLGHGATFLKEHFSDWVEKNGGYENAFDGDEDEEVH